MKLSNNHILSTVFMAPAIANAVFPGFGLLVRPAWTDPAEGTLALFSGKEKRFGEPLDPDLRELGVTDEDWAKVQQKLQDAWHLMGTRKFKEAIGQLNEEIFSKYECIAVYAEYGGKGGQKAMTVYTLVVWESLPR